jgi:phosphoribosylglycinamide formyltransferase-1
MDIAVLISGGGTTLRNLLEWRAAGELSARIVQVISSRADAAGNRFAAEHNIPLAIVERGLGVGGGRQQSQSIFETCRKAEIDLVVLAGFLCQLTIPDDFTNRVINVHPSLIPAFCGKGFYGMRVHEAVLARGCKVTGCTVHFVDNELDHGPIIAQRATEVHAGESPSQLQTSVFRLECDLYPQVINWIADNRVTVKGRNVHVDQHATPTHLLRHPGE